VSGLGLSNVLKIKGRDSGQADTPVRAVLIPSRSDNRISPRGYDKARIANGNGIYKKKILIFCERRLVPIQYT